MRTLALFIAMGCLTAATSGGAAPVDKLGPPGKADAESIARGIDLLGAAEYATREAAERWLWEVGQPALTPLRHAAERDDAEVVMRARELVEMIEMGVPPDAQPELLIQARKLRNGEKPEQVVAVAKLSGMGPAGRSVLRRVAPGLKDEQVRRRALEAVFRNADDEARREIRQGRFDEAYDLLEQAALAGAEPIFDDYAAMALQTDRLEQAIGRAEATDGPARHRLRAVLHRAAGRPGKAADILGQTGDSRRLEALLTEAGRWQALHQHVKARLAGAAEHPPAHESRRRLAALQHLATGDDTAVLKLAEQWGDDDQSRLIELLILNGRPDRAAALLGERPTAAQLSVTMAVGSLPQQRALVESIMAETGWNRGAAPAPDGQSVAPSTLIQVAQWLVQAGRTEQARQLAEQITPEPTPANQQLAAGMLQLGFENHVEPKLADLINWEADDPMTHRLAVAMFGSNDAARRAAVWANVLGEQNLTNADRLSRLRALAKAQTEPDKLAEAVEWFEAWWKQRRPRRLNEALAAAESMGEDGPAWLLKQIEVFGNEIPDAITLYRWLAKHEQWEALKRLTPAPSGDRPGERAATWWLRGLALGKTGHPEDAEKSKRIARLIPLGSARARRVMINHLAFTPEADQRIARDRQLILRVGQPGAYATEWVNMTAADRAQARGDWAEALRRNRRTRLWLLDDSVGAMWGGLAGLDRAARLAQAILDLQAGEADAALQRGKTLADHYPHSIDVTITLVLRFDDADLPAKADALFEHLFGHLQDVCNRYPDSASFHNEAAWLAARCRRGLDTALKLARRAVEIDPDLDPAIDTLAEVHFQRGDRDKAVEWIKKAIRINPDLPYYRKQKQRFESGDPDTAPPE